MRDLQKDLAICNKATPGTWKRNEKPSFGDWWVYSEGQHICLLPADKKGTHYGEMFKANAEFIAAAREGWPHAIERATKAEAKVERLQKVYAITNESWKKQVEELALLRKLAQATWEYFNDPEIINDADIEDALAEYEAWKEEAND
jgi:hypothetical protein